MRLSCPLTRRGLIEVSEPLIQGTGGGNGASALHLDCASDLPNVQIVPNPDTDCVGNGPGQGDLELPGHFRHRLIVARHQVMVMDSVKDNP